MIPKGIRDLSGFSVRGDMAYIADGRFEVMRNLHRSVLPDE
jgi:hypothetical protein